MLQNDGILLEFKAAVGEILYYKTVMDIRQIVNDEEPSAEMNTHIEMNIEQRVVKAENGTFDIDMYIADGFTQRGAEKAPLGTIGQTISTTIDRTGKTLRSSVGDGSAQPSYPAHAVQIGDTWKNVNHLSIPIGENGQTQEADLEHTYKLIGTEQRLGYQTAVIESHSPGITLEIQHDAVQTIGTNSRILFAYNEGRLVQSSVKTITAIKAQGESVTTETTIVTTLEKADSPVLEGGVGQDAFLISM